MGTRYPGVVQGVFEEQMQLNAVATGDGTEIVTRGYATLVMSVTGTFVGTITFEARIGAADWTAVRVIAVSRTPPHRGSRCARHCVSKRSRESGRHA